MPEDARPRTALFEVAVAVGVLGSAVALWPALDDHESWRAFKLLFLSAGAVLAAVALVRGRVPLGLHRGDALALAYAGWGTLSLAVNGRSLATGLGWLHLLVAGALLSLGARQLAPERALRWVIAAVAVVVGLALAEAAGLHLPWDALRRPGSTLGNRNFVAAYVALSLPWVLWQSLRRPSWLWPVLLGAFTGVLVLTRCRGAWLAAASTLALFAVLAALAHRRGQRWPKPARGALLGAALALALGGAVAAAVSWPGLHWKDEHPIAASLARLTALDEGSGLARVEQHRVGWAILKDYPLLGVGPTQWDDAATAHAHAVPGRHARPWSTNPTPSSDWLRCAVETGWPGLLLAALGVLAVLRRAAALSLRGDPAAAALGCGVAAAALIGALDAPLYRPESLAVLAVLVGALPNDTAVAKGKRRVALLVPAALFVAVLATLRFASAATLAAGGNDVASLEAAQSFYWREDLDEQLARQDVDSGHCDRAAPHLARALAASPSRWAMWRLAGLCAAQRGDPRQARDAYEHAAALEPHRVRVVGSEAVDAP